MRILLTILGVSQEPTVYFLHNQSYKASLAPVGLFHLLSPAERPDLVVALCTAEAKEITWPTLRDGIGGDVRIKIVEIPQRASQDDTEQYLHQMIAAVSVEEGRDGIPNRAGGHIELQVDITHGYRHLSFLTYVGLLYLSALTDVQIVNIFYAQREPSGASQFFDLRPLLELPMWFHALRVLKDTGSASAMAQLLRSNGQTSALPTPMQTKARRRLSHELAQELEDMSLAYIAGLPLEFGKIAQHIIHDRLKPLDRILRTGHRLPLSAAIRDRLHAVLAPHALNLPQFGEGWKSSLPLSQEELERQASLIESLLAQGHLHTAVGLLEEWTVSWAIWCLRGEQAGWLDFRSNRRVAAGLLTALSKMQEDPSLIFYLDETQRALALYWRRLKELRNLYHHHGMRRAVHDLHGDDAQNEIFAFWQTHLRTCPQLKLVPRASTSSRILVSPVGKAPGVLFSALMACRDSLNGFPDQVLAVCSKETEAVIPEAVSKVDYRGIVIPLPFEDPLGGIEELPTIEGRAKPHLALAEKVYVNVTGGTTLMGLAVQRLAHLARSFARPTRRFGLIDRRSPEEQLHDPYQRAAVLPVTEEEGE